MKLIVKAGSGDPEASLSYDRLQDFTQGTEYFFSTHLFSLPMYLYTTAACYYIFVVSRPYF